MDWKRTQHWNVDLDFRRGHIKEEDGEYRWTLWTMIPMSEGEKIVTSGIESSLAEAKKKIDHYKDMYKSDIAKEHTLRDSLERRKSLIENKNIIQMASKYAQACKCCGDRYFAGDTIWYDRNRRMVVACVECFPTELGEVKKKPHVRSF